MIIMALDDGIGGDFPLHSRVIEVIASHVPGFCPNPVGKGEYFDAAGRHVYFYLQELHDMDVRAAPDPAGLATAIAELHQKAMSPNGMFGYPIITGRGTQDRTEHWDKSWAGHFTFLFQDLIKLDNQVNGPWPEYDLACRQLIEGVIPRLLGALQSEGRNITPVLVHGDLWEGNVATDKATGKVIIFDADECMYGHNEIEFGTWRCRWASHFKSPIYIKSYQRRIKPSEPVREWDDRNHQSGHMRLSRPSWKHVKNHYAPLENLEKYDPMKDIGVTGILEPYDINAGVVS
ncbi:Protein-ribulosamine 3-kinase, chloroplastic [Cytospora mali]|uniref:protein-ribulosamine 3-kinase n=1 Tax=Cytospora mali TaxID=578113 RepID=A0A194W5J2_CYTMA|nr:Protein-ribulosamine 3-kinase, chloroplastic [Valsa mali]